MVILTLRGSEPELEENSSVKNECKLTDEQKKLQEERAKKLLEDSDKPF